MSKAAASVMIGVFEHLVCLRISGRANFASSIEFKKVVSELHKRGHRRFVLDVTDCQMMDSTFLGTLAGIGLDFAKGSGNGASASLELLNPNERISDLLEGLGVAHLFSTVKAEASDPEKLKELEASQPANRVELARNCLEAHQLLMSINPENVGKFRDCTRFLAEDLKRLESQVADPTQG